VPTDKATTLTPEQKNIERIMTAFGLERSAPDATYTTLLKQETELAELQQKINPLLAQEAKVLKEDSEVRAIISAMQNDLATKHKTAIEEFEEEHRISQKEIEEQILKKQQNIQDQGEDYKRSKDAETIRLGKANNLTQEEIDAQLLANIGSQEWRVKQLWEETATEPEKQYKRLTEQFKKQEEALKQETAPLDKFATEKLLEKTKALQQQKETEINNSNIYKTLLATEPTIKKKRPDYTAETAVSGLMTKQRLHSLVKKDVLQQMQKVSAVKKGKEAVREPNDLKFNLALKSAVEYSIAQLEQENPLLQKELRKQCLDLGWKNNNGNLEYTTPTGSLIKMSDVLALTYNTYVENANKLDISSGKNNIPPADKKNLQESVNKTKNTPPTAPEQQHGKPAQSPEEPQKPKKPEKPSSEVNKANKAATLSRVQEARQAGSTAAPTTPTQTQPQQHQMLFGFHAAPQKEKKSEEIAPKSNEDTRLQQTKLLEHGMLLEFHVEQEKKKKAIVPESTQKNDKPPPLPKRPKVL